jgi:hypothetical protein
MDLRDYTDQDLISSLEAEIAKASNELRCLQADADKISARLRFALVVLHTLKQKMKG